MSSPNTVHLSDLLDNLDRLAAQLDYLGDEDNASLVRQVKVVLISLNNVLADLQNDDLQDYLEDCECEGEA